MKEITRQLILLIGVLTLLASSLVVINTQGFRYEEPKDSIENNETDVNKSSNTTEPETIIGKSIRGYQIMIGNIGELFTPIEPSEPSQRP